MDENNLIQLLDDGSNDDGNNMIQLRDVYKVFNTKNGDIHAISGVSLDIGEGEIFGIIGMSGAGKTTLVRCINYLETPTSGDVIIDGQNLSKLMKWELNKLRHSVGMVFQGFNLLMQRNVERNVIFPALISGMERGEAKKRAAELLEIVGLEDKAKSYPAQLSGGQKQRVAIARALMLNPKVLLCDEATSALDPMTTRSILQLLKDINQRMGITIVIITHEMSVIREICTRVAVMDGSKIAEEGTVQEVFLNPKTKAALRLFFNDDSAVSRPSGLSVGNGNMYRLTFDGSNTYEPILSGLILSCWANINIIHADIQHVGGQSLGHMVVQLPEDEDSLRSALAYLKDKNVPVEEVKDIG